MALLGEVDAIRISLASPDTIREWSYGEVKKPGRGFTIALATNDSFGFFLALSAVSLVALQAIVNMGVAVSAFPTTGVTLPFFSYGGSSLMTVMITSGIVLSVSRGARV